MLGLLLILVSDLAFRVFVLGAIEGKRIRCVMFQRPGHWPQLCDLRQVVFV